MSKLFSVLNILLLGFLIFICDNNMDSREREFKTTPQQWKVIVDYLEENPILLKSKFQNYDGDNSETIQHWKTLAHQLNSMGSGMRSVDKWKTAVGRWKSKTKAKASAIRKEQLKTGGGVSKVPPLNSVEERLMGIFGWKSVTGDNNRELGFGLLPKDTKVTSPTVHSPACTITSADAGATTSTCANLQTGLVTEPPPLLPISFPIENITNKRATQFTEPASKRIKKSSDKTQRFVSLNKMHVETLDTLKKINKDTSTMASAFSEISSDIKRYVNFVISKEKEHQTDS